MSNLVIVAIPAADETVWKVSSEKVPHMTLLWLGPLEADDNVQRMADFIEHAVEVSEHGPFYATVDYRDELGPDKADVLYFKDDRSMKWLNSFRNQLLQQNDIRAEFEEQEAAGNQYPEWVPHLTLGYPDAPAKPLPNDYPIYSVCFDRIALWTTDFDGPEFRLEWPERDESAYPSLQYSDIGAVAVSNILGHSGVKGMKWGVRKDVRLESFHRNEAAKLHAMADKTAGRGVGPLKGKASEGYRKEAQKHEAKANALQAKRAERGDKSEVNVGNKKSETVTVGGKTKQVTPGKAAKLDAKWVKNQYTLEKGVERHNAMAEHFNGRLGTINDKFKNEDFSKENHDHPASWSPKYKEYMGHIGKLEEASFRHAVEQVHGASPTGKMKAGVELAHDGQTLRMVINHNTEVKHAAKDEGIEESYLFHVVRDASGLILDIAPVDDLDEGGEVALEQTALGKQFILSHTSVLDDADVRAQIKAKVQDILEDVAGSDANDDDLNLFGDPLIITKLQSVLNDFFNVGVDKSAAYSAMGEAVVEHYGIKGMRWGRRTRGDHGSPPAPVAPHATSRVPHGDKRKTKIEAEGGQNHPAHDDAIHVAKAQAKLKKSGVAALSNKELRDVATRVQLEQQVSMLTGHKGKQFVKRQLGIQGQQTVQRGLTRGIATGAAKKGGKAALLFA